MKKTAVWAVALALGLSVVVGAAPTGKKNREPVPPTMEEWKGVYSGITEGKTLVIMDPPQWKGLWEEHSQIEVPPPPIPAINFNLKRVVGIFLGERPSGGYSVEVVSVRTQGTLVVVSWREKRPPPGYMSASVMSSPYYLKVIPRSNAPVLFEKLPSF